MEIDISKRRLKEACRMLRKIEDFDYSKIADGNKMSDVYEFTAWCEEFRVDLEDQMEEEE